MGAVEPFTTMYTHVKEIIEEKNEADTFVAISIVRYVENLSFVLLVNPSSPSHQINHQSCRSDVPPEQECCVPQRQPSSSKVVHNHSPACVCFMLTDFCSSIHLPRPLHSSFFNCTCLPHGRLLWPTNKWCRRSKYRHCSLSSRSVCLM